MFVRSITKWGFTDTRRYSGILLQSDQCFPVVAVETDLDCEACREFQQQSESLYLYQVEPGDSHSLPLPSWG
jgi:hypothetical protein